MARNPNWGGARDNRSALARPTVKRIELDDDVAEAVRNGCVIRYETASKADVTQYVNDLLRKALRMTPMTSAELAALNAAYETARTAQPDESTHILTHAVAVEAGLEAVRHDDQSGTLYRDAAGRYAYGWESGGFDDQIGE